MKRVCKSWMAVVAAALLLGTLVGVVWARPNDRPRAADITRKVTLAGADFTPAEDGFNYVAGGQVYCVTGSCDFAAPVVFPCLPAVTVEHIRLHVNDANAVAKASATLYRAKPSEGVYDVLANVSSPDGTSDGVQTYSSGAINKVVRPGQRAYIFLLIGGPNIAVKGITVEYHRNI